MRLAKRRRKIKHQPQPLESCKWNVTINLLDAKIKLSLLFHFCAHVEQNIKLCYRNMAYVWLIKQLQTFLVGNGWILMCKAQIITPLHNNWATNLLSKYKKNIVSRENGKKRFFAILMQCHNNSENAKENR